QLLRLGFQRRDGVDEHPLDLAAREDALKVGLVFRLLRDHDHLDPATGGKASRFGRPRLIGRGADERDVDRIPGRAFRTFGAGSRPRLAAWPACRLGVLHFLDLLGLVAAFAARTVFLFLLVAPAPPGGILVTVWPTA